jgi:Calx-beta domain/Lamin Tail Domain/WD40-like Beta Propeller Repeat
MRRARLVALILAGVVLVCLVVLRAGLTQSPGLRRITNTTEEGINLNPSISGDGRVVGFESTEDVAAAGGGDHFRAIRANISVDPATFFQLAGSRAVTPAISQDGSRIAFASKDDPLGTNPDGNSEIYLFDGAKLLQITKTSPASLADRVTQGNFQPSISDDGRFIAFSSNRDLAGQNSDGNLEIFVYDTNTTAFAQLTNSSGVIGNTDAKISGDGSTVGFIRDNGVTPSSARDLMKQPRVGPASATVLAVNVQALAMTYGRAISDDGLRVVYAAQTATNTTQVFLYDGRTGGVNRQITSLGARVTEVPLHPTISGDGSRIAFAARRSVSGAPTNSDGGVELYVYDFPTSTFSKITNASSSATADVVSSLSDDGMVVAFSFPRILSGAVANSGTENNSEIYTIAPPVRAANGTLTAILNHASFGHEPSPVKAVAPDSIAVAQGTNLASTTLQSQKLPNGTFPTNVAGTRVTVNGRDAQIFFVSPAQVIFLVPPQTEIGTAEVIVTNVENFPSRGNVPTLRAAPGVFTKTGDGIGEGQILNSDTLQEGPFDPTGGNLHLSIFATGARNATQTIVSIGGRLVNADSVIASSNMPGLDEVHVRVPSDLRGAGNVNLSVISDGRESNPVTVNFLGDPSRAILFNEVLADPPDGAAGDANHDGVRDGTQDEFVELVNGSAGETIGLSGWTIKTRATGSTTETTRFTFPSGTSLPAGQSLVVFGGGGPAFNPNDEIFGCAQVLKISSSSGLSLTNTGLTILIRDTAGNLITQFSYGGSTGLDGNASQSLTRSPDITGSFVLHTAALNANNRRFSPGLRTDGTPFGNCPGRLTSVSISPAGTSIVIGQTAQFTAQAVDQYGRTMTGIPITFTSDNTNVAIIESVSTNAGVATATVRSKNPGTAHITASATDGGVTINSPPANLTVTGPSLSINDVSLNEGNAGTTTFTFTVSLSTPAPAPVTFDIATQDNTATVADTDYVARSLTSQTIPAGQQTYSFDVTVNGDPNLEPNESFFVNVTNIAGASVTDSQGVGTIISDDIPVLSINDVSANEGNSGTTTFTFTVTSTMPAPAPGITFDIATANGTAQAGTDYVARSLTSQTIPAGQTSYTFDVTVNGDTLVEPNETFLVNISNPSANATINDSQGVGTILNDDAASLVISQVYPGGGLSSASFSNDYIEVFNRGTTTVDFSLTPYSAQFLSVGGSTWAKSDLTSGSIAPGRYFLIREASGGAVGAALPTADATGTINLTSTTAGKVALVSGTTLLTGNCPGDDGSVPFNAINGTIADFVGYGSSASTANHCYEGSGPSSFTLSNNTIADFRKGGGCIDTNDNAADFLTAAPFPRNSNSPTNSCAGGATPNLLISDATVTEGNSGTTNATFTVTLTSPPQGVDVTFNIATQNGSATTANNDYVARSLTNQIIPSGQTSYTFTVVVNGDTALEPDETFLVNVTNVAGANVTDGQGQGTIQNDDLPSLSINDVSANEGNSGTATFSFTVSLSAPAVAPVTFDIATQDGSATVANNDYVARSLTGQTIAAGQSTYTFDVTVNGDGFNEGIEDFFVNVTNVSGATVLDGQGLGTIQNDDSPALSIDDVTLSEGDTGAAAFIFTITLSPVSGDTVMVNYATADGTAVAPSDYTAISSTQLTFAPGEMTKQITVQVNGDKLVEENETFSVNLSGAVNAAINKAAGIGTITNDDTPNLVISQVYGGGNNSGAPLQNDFVEIFNRGTTTVDFALTPYSIQYASVGSNFGGTTASAKTNLTTGSIAPGKYFLVQESGGTTNGVALPTPDVTGSIALAATSGKVALVAGTIALAAASCPGDDGSAPFNPSGVTIADFVGYGSTAGNTGQCYEGPGPAPAPSNTTADFRRAGGCIDTNDNAANLFASAPAPRNSSSPANNCAGGAVPNLSINDVTLTEGDSGTTTATFTVSVSAAAQGADVTFDIATANGTATTANSDYVSHSLTSQIIPAGQTTYSFAVTIRGDAAVEGDETFFVNVTNVSGANVIDGQGQGTIQNDDLPALSIDDVSLTEGNSGTKLFSFHVTLSAASASAVTFDIATQDSTATVANSDYVARSLTGQTITAGQTSYTFDVTVNGDTNIEPNEAFFVNVTNVSGATVIDGQGLGTIVNDDSPTFTINDASLAEGDAGTSTATFTVTLAPASNTPVTVDYATANGTATAGSDYQSTNNTLTFNIGETTKQINVTINGDTLVEPDETFFVNLTNATGGATIGDAQGLGTIQNDDTANLVISQIYPGGGLTSAVFTNDFVEVFNRGTTTINFAVTPYSIQFLSTSGSTWAKTDLASGTIVPGGYFLIRETSGGAAGASLPTADATGTINLTSTTAGKVALVAGATLLTGSCPGDDGSQPFNPGGGGIADFVGYLGNSSTANHCYEGSAPAAFTSGNNTIADFRKAGGCTDTNDNAADFFTSTPFPRNSTSPVNSCAGGTPNLSINDVSIAEGNTGTTTATFTVSLSAPAQGADVTFDIATQDNTATTGNNDYVAIPLTSHVIPAGQTSFTFSVTINGDTAVEPNEAFFVNVTNVAGANVTDGQGVGTIQNDDLPTLSVDDVSATEGDSGTKTFSFHVTLSAPAPAAVSFDIATADGSATTANNDYVARSLTNQTIAQGGTSFTFDVTVNGDQAMEPSENFLVNVSNVSGATVLDGQGQGTIQNDDSPILSINDVSMAEGNTGTTTFTFTVTSSLPAPAGGITFDIATSDGTAQDDNPVNEDNDYVAKSLTSQTIPATQTTYTFDVTVNGDKLVEPDETFNVTISNASSGGAAIGDGTGIGTIQNDDTALLVISQLYGGGNNSGATFQNDFVEIFNRGTTTVNFAVTPYSVQYASQAGSFSGSASNFIALNSGSLIPGQYFLLKLAGGTTNGVALPPEDASNTSLAMSATDGKVALVVGTTTATTAAGCPTGVTVADFVGYGGANCSETSPTAALSATKSALRKSDGCIDTDNNLNDFTTPTLSSGTPPRNSASTINDCNVPPTLSVDNISATEGNSGTKLFTFTVSLSKPALAGGVSFDIATQDDSASAGSDYVIHSLTNQTIAAGQQTYTFDVTVNGDTDVETDETFFVNVTNVTGATVIDGQGLGTIQNDDTPSLTINDVTLNEGNSGTTSFNFTVTLAPASNQTVTVNYATADGTATAPSDYTAISLTQLTFLAGETTKPVSVTVNGDTTVEPDETFTVNLSGATNANIGDSQGVGTITNDDGATVVISQVYAGGGNMSAQYINDFVEIFNRTSTVIDVSNWSIQTATGTGTAWTVTRLCPVSQTCTIGANKYYLVQLGSGGGVGAALPASDATGTPNLAVSGAKVVLVNNTTALSGSAAGTAPLGGATCPTANLSGVIDFFGFGTATCFEGSAAAAALTNTTAAFRASSGCTDANANSTDFSAAAPSPRNSASPLHICP